MATRLKLPFPREDGVVNRPVERHVALRRRVEDKKGVENRRGIKALRHQIDLALLEGSRDLNLRLKANENA